MRINYDRQKRLFELSLLEQIRSAVESQAGVLSSLKYDFDTACVEDGRQRFSNKSTGILFGTTGPFTCILQASDDTIGSEAEFHQPSGGGPDSYTFCFIPVYFRNEKEDKEYKPYLDDCSVGLGVSWTPKGPVKASVELGNSGWIFENVVPEEELIFDSSLLNRVRLEVELLLVSYGVLPKE